MKKPTTFDSRPQDPTITTSFGFDMSGDDVGQAAVHSVASPARTIRIAVTLDGLQDYRKAQGEQEHAVDHRR